MENYAAERFNMKIESLESEMMELTGERRIVTSIVHSGKPSNEENQEINEIVDCQQRRCQESSQQQQVGLVATIQPSPVVPQFLTPIRVPAILDGEFFNVVKVEDTNVLAQCLYCDKVLSGNLKSTGNFLSHVKRLHPFLMEKIKSKISPRKPAIAYFNVLRGKSKEQLKMDSNQKKMYTTQEERVPTEEVAEQTQEWTEPQSTVIRRGNYSVEAMTSPETTADAQKIQPQVPRILDDEFDAIGKNIAAKLRAMRLDQRIVAEKLLHDVLFEAQLGRLHRDSTLQV